jgi:hypothetical protein
LHSLEQIKDEEESEKASEIAWDKLFSSMSEEHVALVIKDLGKYSELREKGQNASLGSLSGICSEMVFNFIFDTTGFKVAGRMIKSDIPGNKISPLSLPHKVAEIYIKNPWALPIIKCIACNYWSPLSVDKSRKAARYFKECPICGEALG